MSELFVYTWTRLRYRETRALVEAALGPVGELVAHGPDPTGGRLVTFGRAAIPPGP